MLHTHSPLIMASLGSDTCCCVCIKYVHCPWWPTVFERFGHLHFVYCACAGFSGGEAWEDKLHACYCSHAIQHVMWFTHTLLAIKVVCHECIIGLRQLCQDNFRHNKVGKHKTQCQHNRGNFQHNRENFRILSYNNSRSRLTCFEFPMTNGV